MKKMGLMKISLAILFIFISVGIGLFFYLNLVFLPKKGLPLLTENLEKALKRKVSLESLSYKPLTGLALSNLTIFDTGEYPDLALVEIDSIQLKISLFRFLAKRDIGFKARVAVDEEGKLCLTSIGNYNLRQKEGKINIISNEFPIVKLVSSWKHRLPLEINTGVGWFRLQSALERRGNLELEADLKLERIEAAYQNLKVSGGLSVTGEVQQNLNQPEKPTIQGNILLEGLKLDGLPYLQTVDSINGKVQFTERQLDTTNLKAQVSEMPLSLSGKLEDYHNPFIQLTIQSKYPIAETINFLPQELRNRLENIQLQGDNLLEVKLAGNLKDREKLNWSAVLDLVDVSIDSKLPAFKATDIKGKVKLEKDKLKISNLELKYREADYLLNGTLVNFPSPVVEADLSSEDISIDAKFKKMPDLIQLDRVKGRYINSSFDLTGDITNLKEPDVDISGTSNLELSNLPLKLVKDLRLGGLFDLGFQLKGKAKEIKQWRGNLRGKSPKVSIFGLKARQVTLNTTIKKGLFSLTELIASFYNGILKVQGDYNLSIANRPFKVKLETYGINLKELKGDTPLSQKDIEGILEANLELSGYGEILKNLKGSGKVKIADGKLWEFKLLGGIADMINLPQLKETRFSQATGNFRIENQKISTEDLRLSSDKVDLLTKGSVDFAGNLDLTVRLILAKELTEKFPFLAKTVGLLIDGMGRLSSQLKVTGTLKSPKYAFVILPVREIIEEKLKDIFEDILR